MNAVTCKKCKWVYFAVSREYAKFEVSKFNEYWETLSKEDRERAYGNCKANIKDYEFCQCGNSYKNFRKAKSDDCSSGNTLSPIIQKKD